MALQEELESQGNYLFKYRGLLPIIILVLGLIVFIYRESTVFPGAYNFSEEVYSYFCLFVSLVGFIIRIYAVGHSPENTSGRNTQTQVADQLNTTGLYSIVRHPLYVGNFFMYLGIGMLTKSISFIAVFTLFFWVYYERIMFAEEQFLRRKFGESYLRWAAKTPAFIPALQGFKSPKYPFSWKKIFKKEKNGFFALFLVFYLFDFIEANLNSRDFTFEINFWFVAMLLSALSYLIFKYLKKKTNILHEAGR